MYLSILIKKNKVNDVQHKSTVNSLCSQNCQQPKTKVIKINFVFEEGDSFWITEQI